MSQERERSERARLELQETLDAIEDKLNVPKRFGELRETAVKSWQVNPLPWIIGAVAGVIAIGGLIAWAISDDD